MFKNMILSLLIIISFSAEATLPRVSYDDYVHWPDPKKEEFHIKLMELVVQVESRYKLETQKYGYSETRYQKYVEALRTIQSQLFIPSAYAMGRNSRKQPEPDGSYDELQGRKKAQNVTWDSMAQAFGLLSKKNIVNTSQNIHGTCLFAGWVSRAVKRKGEIVCAHPDFIGGTAANRAVTLESVQYPAPKAGSGCEDKKDNINFIQCNPVIFGYKKASDQSLFCVPTNNKAESAAYDCMKAALDIEKVPGADSKEDRLKDLKGRYAQNKSAFNNVFEFNYKTCVCSVPQNGYSKEYQNYMRPLEGQSKKDSDRYRTCFGMMKMMSESVKECELPITDKGLFSSFEKFLEANQSNIVSGKDADKYYDDFIRVEMKKSRESVIAYNTTCNADVEIPDAPKPQPPKKTYACKASCEDAPKAEDSDAPLLSCSYDVYDSADPTKKLDAKPEKDPESRETKTVTIKHKDLPAEGIQCNVEYKDRKKEYECKATCDKPKPATATPAATEGGTPAQPSGFNCKYEVSEKGDASKKLEGAKPEKEPESVDVKSILVKHKDLGEGLNCEIKWNEPTTATTAGEKEPKISVTITNKGITEYTVVAKTTDEQDYKFEWYFENKPAGLVLEEGWKNEVVTSASSTPAKPSDAIPGIADDTGAATTPAATTDAKPDGRLPQPRAPAAETKAEVTPVTATPATATATAATPSTPTATTAATGGSSSEKSREIKQKRMASAYQVCGRLVKGEKKIHGCVTIDAISSAAPTAGTGNMGNGGNGPQQPQVQIRGASDTSAVGIK